MTTACITAVDALAVVGGVVLGLFLILLVTSLVRRTWRRAGRQK